MGQNASAERAASEESKIEAIAREMKAYGFANPYFADRDPNPNRFIKTLARGLRVTFFVDGKFFRRVLRLERANVFPSERERAIVIAAFAFQSKDLKTTFVRYTSTRDRRFVIESSDQEDLPIESGFVYRVEVSFVDPVADQLPLPLFEGGIQ